MKNIHDYSPPVFDRRVQHQQLSNRINVRLKKNAHIDEENQRMLRRLQMVPSNYNAVRWEQERK